VKRLLAAEDRHATAKQRILALEPEEKARSEKVSAILARLPTGPQ
jgi:hypothetical protein